MMDFSQRSTQAELMDDPSVGREEFRACLADLARVNALTMNYRPTLRFFERLLARARTRGRPLEVVDVGSGYGDMLRTIARWARRQQLEVSLTGVDLNPWSRVAAVEATDPGLGIAWVTADALAYNPPRGIDVVISSLFTHHLHNPQIVELIQWMEARARLGWFINDLHRHRLPYHGFRLLAALVSAHAFVRHDGPVSIRRAFVRADWERLLVGAGVAPDTAEVEWMFPFRMTVARYKEAGS